MYWLVKLSDNIHEFVSTLLDHREPSTSIINLYYKQLLYYLFTQAKAPVLCKILKDVCTLYIPDTVVVYHRKLIVSNIFVYTLYP